MGRLVSAGWAGLLLGLSLGLTGCSSSSSTPPSQVPPASVTLSPTPNLSLDLGGTQTFTASALNSKRVQLAIPIFFVSSNPAVVTVAANGLACAGTWDSLTNPQICTPGTVGVAQVTATSRGISSPPTTVWVHDHIDHIVITPVTAPTTPCFSKGQTFIYQANAFSQGRDITNMVGPFTWQFLNTAVVSISTTASGLLSNQVLATANVPGLTSFFAINSGVNSSPMAFQTCAVQSIALNIENTDDTSFIIPSGGKTIVATVTDTLGNEITGVQLNWASSDPSVITVSSSGLATSTAKPGGANIIASCIPNGLSPGCNVGFQPPQAIYPEAVITGTVIPTGTTAVQSTTSILVSSTGCGTDDNCVTQIIPVDPSKNVPVVGADLPATPDSLVFSPTGTTAFLGTDRSLLGTKGLMVVTPATTVTTAPTVSLFSSAPGKILTISNTGKLITADTPDFPGVSLVNGAASPPTSTSLPITGATAAAFSPDEYKLYIVAGNKLYFFSTQEALKSVALSSTGTAVSFLSNGAFTYVAGEQSGTVTARKTCDNTVARDAAGNQQVISLPSTPQFLETVPDSSKFLTMNSPGSAVSLVPVNTTPVGCASPAAVPPGGLPTVSHGAASTFDLGQGTLDVKEIFVSSDSTRVYVIAANLGTIPVFHLDSQARSGIQLAGNVLPVSAAITSDGKRLYVIASDQMVHVLDTVNETDLAQIPFPDGMCHVIDKPDQKLPCKPDLIAVKP